MTKALIITGIAIFFVFSLFLLSFSQETLTITTYYPSPYGSYRELRAQRMAIGENYIRNADYCWEGTCTNTIDPNADLVVEGNVGIGTTAPQARLHISGGRFRITDGVEEAQPNEIWATASIINYSVRGWHRFVINSDNAVNPGGDNFDVYNVNTSGTPLFRVNSSGNVGIGTASPQARLDVAGQIYRNNSPWIQRGSVSTNQTWVTVTFPIAFSSIPVVIAQSQTKNGSDLMTVEVRNVTTASFQVHVSDADGSHVTESIGWIAIAP